MRRDLHCCLCGELRRPTQKPVESFGNDLECITIGEHRALQEGRWEVNPQLLVNVSMWRNGGTASGQTHICDGCIIVGLQAAKRFVDGSLATLSPQPASGTQADGRPLGVQTMTGEMETAATTGERADG